MEEPSNITPEPSFLTTDCYQFPVAVRIPTIGHPHLMLPWLIKLKIKPNVLINLTPALLLCSLMNETPFFCPVAQTRRNLGSLQLLDLWFHSHFSQQMLSSWPLWTYCLSPFSIPISSALGHTLITFFRIDTYKRLLLPVPSLGSLLPWSALRTAARVWWSLWRQDDCFTTLTPLPCSKAFTAS